MKNTLIITIITIFFIGGLITGLTLTGLFGTLDKPAPLTLKLIKKGIIPVNKLGVPLRKLETIYKGIKHQKLQIIPNTIKSIKEPVETIYIQTSLINEDRLEYERKVVLQKGWLDGAEYKEATINNKQGKIKLKGHGTDHFRTKKYSLRIKIKEPNNLIIYNIQNPNIRNYLSEYVFQQNTKQEGILGLQTEYKKVKINGENKGIYHIEEHYTPNLLKRQNKPVGSIVTFDETLLWLGLNYDYNHIRIRQKLLPYFKIKSYINDNGAEQLKNYKNYTPEQIFNITQLAKYYALADLHGAMHGLAGNNLKFYQDPNTKLLEPITFDGNAGSFGENMAYLNPRLTSNYSKWLFNDKTFFKEYITQLTIVTKKSYLDNMFKNIEKDMQKNINIIRKDNHFYYFDKQAYYNNAETLQQISTQILEEI